MPRVRRVPRLRRSWPKGAVWHLMTGLELRGDGFGTGAGFDRVAASAAWFELRDQVEAALAERQRSCHGHYPIRRPWAWWAFEAPEPRNYEISEAEQLSRLDLLTNEEREAQGDYDVEE